MIESAYGEGIAALNLSRLPRVNGRYPMVSEWVMSHANTMANTVGVAGVQVSQIILRGRDVLNGIEVSIGLHGSKAFFDRDGRAESKADAEAHDLEGVDVLRPAKRFAPTARATASDLAQYHRLVARYSEPSQWLEDHVGELIEREGVVGIDWSVGLFDDSSVRLDVAFDSMDLLKGYLRRGTPEVIAAEVEVAKANHLGEVSILGPVEKTLRVTN